MDCLERSWYRLFAGHTITVAPNIPDLEFENHEFDCLVLTGGGDSVARHLTENRLYEIAKQRAKPILGFCHGAFAINDLEGGINSYINGHVDVAHHVMMGTTLQMVNSYHSQAVAKLAPAFDAVATDQDGNAEAFKHTFLDIWGVVWHPERMTDPVLPPYLADFLRTDISPF